MTALQSPPPAPLPTEPSSRRRVVLWSIGVVALVVAGNYLLWSDRPDQAEVGSYTEQGAAVYVEITAPDADRISVADVVAGGLADELEVTSIEEIGTARTETGEVQLLTLTGVDDAGTGYVCLATIETSGRGSVCGVGPDDSVQVSWGEASVSDGTSESRIERSVTLFNAPPAATSVFVVLDTGRYVGADVVRGASRISWADDIGAVGLLVVLDADGGELYRQVLGR